MKKILCIVSTLVLALGLTACGAMSGQSEPVQDAEMSCNIAYSGAKDGVEYDCDVVIGADKTLTGSYSISMDDMKASNDSFLYTCTDEEFKNIYLIFMSENEINSNIADATSNPRPDYNIDAAIDEQELLRLILSYSFCLFDHGEISDADECLESAIGIIEESVAD